MKNFFFNDTATTEIYTLSLHDALPIFDEAVSIHNALLAARRVLGAQIVVVIQGRSPASGPLGRSGLYCFCLMISIRTLPLSSLALVSASTSEPNCEKFANSLYCANSSLILLDTCFIALI